MVIRRTLASVQPVPREVQAFTTGEPLLARLRQPGVWAAATSVLIPTVAVILTEQPRATATVPVSASASTSVEARIEPRVFSLVRSVHTQSHAAPASAAQRPRRKVTANRARTATQRGVTEHVVAPPGSDRSAVLRFALAQVGQRYRFGG